jgi:hypothetical protein
MKSIYLFAAILLALPMAAETLPDAPKPHLDRVEWAMLASDAGGRALDAYSTRWSLCNGNREKFLPDFIVNHTGRLAVFEGGMVTADYFVARSLIRRRHRKLARIILLADALQVWPWAIRNLTMPKARR